MTPYDRVAKIIAKIRYPERCLILTDHETHLTIHVEYYEQDVDDPNKDITLQKSRRWLIEPDATETDVVATCFAAIMRSFEHVVREHFLYDGRPIYTPHHTLDLLSFITMRRPA